MNILFQPRCSGALPRTPTTINLYPALMENFRTTVWSEIVQTDCEFHTKSCYLSFCHIDPTLHLKPKLFSQVPQVYIQEPFHSDQRQRAGNCQEDYLRLFDSDTLIDKRYKFQTPRVRYATLFFIPIEFVSVRKNYQLDVTSLFVSFFTMLQIFLPCFNVFHFSRGWLAQVPYKLVLSQQKIEGH